MGDWTKRLHYVEYLAALITKNDVDPLDIFSSDELETLLQTASIRRPSRSLPPNAPLVAYRRRLLEVLPKELILFFSFCFSLFFVVAWKCTRHLPIYCRFTVCAFLRLRSCSQHYIEYLVQLINFKKIDPLSVFEGSELIAQLRRSDIDIPERLENETDADFYGRCAQVKLIFNSPSRITVKNINSITMDEEKRRLLGCVICIAKRQGGCYGNSVAL